MAKWNTTHAPLDRMITLRVDNGTQANWKASVQATVFLENGTDHKERPRTGIEVVRIGWAGHRLPSLKMPASRVSAVIA